MQSNFPSLSKRTFFGKFESDLLIYRFVLDIFWKTYKKQTDFRLNGHCMCGKFESNFLLYRFVLVNICFTAPGVRSIYKGQHLALIYCTSLKNCYCINIRFKFINYKTLMRVVLASLYHEKNVIEYQWYQSKTFQKWQLPI